MAKWWEQDMSDAGQAMYVDPQFATELATTPDALMMNAEQQKQQANLAQDQKAGFWQDAMKSVGDFFGKVDKSLDKALGPVWGGTKAVGSAVWYPIDKTAQGMRWAYSEGFSQPFSTLLLQTAKAEMGEGDFFTGWADSYAQANNLSPGQVVMNYEMTKAAAGEPGGLGLMYGATEIDTSKGIGPLLAGALPGGSMPVKYAGKLSEAEREDVKRQQGRFLVNKDYWEKSDYATYTKGSGATDFFFVIFGDPTAPLLGGAVNAIRAARSAQFVDDGLGLVRTRGNAVDYAASKLPGAKGAPQTAEEFFTADKNMNKFYDWVVEPSVTGASRKTAAEIAAHPVWGRGRRSNPFTNQFSEALAKMPRDDMNLVMRFAAGDSTAASQLAAKGTQTLDDIGRLSENRVMLQSHRTDPEAISFFARIEDAYPGTPVPYTGTQLFEPPSPRPSGPNATEAQKRGWDLRWGPLAERAKLGPQEAQAVRGGLMGGIRPLGPIGGVNADDVVRAEQWKTAQLDLIETELKSLANESATFSTLLGPNMGRAADEFEAGASNLFGTMDRAYRAGGLGLRSTEKAADAKFARTVADRKGRFATQGYRKGFYGTPARVITSLGDRVPQGRIDHNAEDATDRLTDMLKQVPGLGPDARSVMIDRYVTAGDKVAKSKMLDQLNTEIVHHIAGRVHGLDPEVAQILSELSKSKINETLNKLTKGNFRPTEQQFAGVTRPGESRTIDMIEDGEGWIVAPLAKTQLEATDTLLPIIELNKAIGRASGALKSMRSAGALADDAVKYVVDPMNTIWKAATLLRPGYVPRMISEEAIASAIKFGFMSRLLADPAIGTRNFVDNRISHLAAVTGLGSYIPSTGKGLMSRNAIIKLEDEGAIQGVVEYKRGLQARILAEQDPYARAQLEAEHEAIRFNRVKVNKALPVVQTRIAMEKELSDNLTKDVERWNAQIEKLRDKPDQVSALKAEALRMKVASAQDDILDHQQVIAEFTDYSDEILRVAINSIGKRMGEGTFTHNGREIPQAFSKAWENPITRDQISSSEAFQSLYARGESVDMGRAIKTGSWTTIDPDMPQHMDSWLRALNFQFRQDDLFRLVAKDDTGKEALAFLQTPAGKNHLRDLGPRARNGKQLVEDIKFVLDKYLPVRELQLKMANGEEITAAELAGNISKTEYPIVHGEEVKYLTSMFAKHASESIVTRTIQAGFNRLGSIPSDLMSRHPTYSRFFEARMRTMIDQDAAFKKSVGKDTAYTSAELETMKNKADKLARKDMSQIVYDPNRTMGGEALRFVFPFFNAHADGLARWAGLMGERPQEFTKLARIYNAPVSANLVTDQYGNALDPDGTVTVKDPITGKFIEKHSVNINERVLHLRLPWNAKNEGSIPIKMSAINTILPGDPWFHPGSGPLVQVPASQLAKASPTVGSFLQWSKILPYGPTDTTTAFTPKYMRAIYDRYKAGDPDGEAYQKAFLAAYNKRVADYKTSAIDPATGDHVKKFTVQDVEKDARDFLNLEILTAWGSPVQTQQDPLTGSPYQFFVDEYRKMQDVYKQDARDQFLSKYGEDYYHFTASLTKSMGIAATESADDMATKYQDLIEKDPDMAPFIIGNIYNGGPFNTSVYKKQLEQSFGGEWVREKITAQNAIEANQIDQGWQLWNKAKMELDATLIRAGFRSYTESGAENFNAVRANLVNNIGAQYPAWGNEYAVADRGKIPSRISAFERLTRDERLLNDPFRSEVKMLRIYLDKRAMYQQALRARGGKQLSFNLAQEGTGENADIANAWNYEVTNLINKNIAFNQLYNRYLSNDRLQ